MGNQFCRVSVVLQGEVEHRDSVVSEVDGSEHDHEHVSSGDQIISNSTTTGRKIRVIAAQSSELFDLAVVPSHDRITVRDVLLRFPSGHFLTSFDAEAKNELNEKLASPLNGDTDVLTAPNTYVLFPTSRLYTRVIAGEYTHFAHLIEMHELHALRQAELEKEGEGGVAASRALGCRILERSKAKRYCNLDLAELEKEEEGLLNLRKRKKVVYQHLELQGVEEMDLAELEIEEEGAVLACRALGCRINDLAEL
ncbi:hypothetical protein KP509_17G023600 [Ceratopteris richardii]|uniref:Uncharacterized protein n=1 Tax=Ceratopteris richardii TaxID=49495 RepID=A0A8T2SWB1_CERRI|nr:hypothetical protein KP509_17G023600 [Ceratopteris richardii]